MRLSWRLNWHAPAVRIADEFLVERVMRVLHGHSISGERPDARFSPPVMTFCGRNCLPSLVVPKKLHTRIICTKSAIS